MAWLEYLALHDPVTLETLVLWPMASNGSRIGVIDLDLGFPAVREVVEAYPSSDGSTDYTSLFGARAISLTLLIMDGAYAAPQTRDELAAWMVPSRRVQMHFRYPGSETRMMTLRANSMSNSLSQSSLRTNIHDPQLQWVCPSGRIYSELETFTEVPWSSQALDGLVFPVTFPVVFPAQAGVGAQAVTNYGNTASAPVIRLFGPTTNPGIENETSGRTLSFYMGLGPGDYVEIDMAEKTCQFNGTPGAASNLRKNLIDKEWFTLAPGQNWLRYFSDYGDIPAQAQIYSRDAWI